MEEEEINILDYWRVLWRRKGMIITLFLVTVIITMVMSLRMPKTYKAKTTILPPMGESLGASTLGLRALGVRGFPSLSRGVSTTNIILVMLKSHRMARDVAERFNPLKKRYNVTSQNITSGMVQQMTEISTTREGAIDIVVLSPDAQLAADMANFYTQNLEKLNEELKISSEKPFVKILDPAFPPKHEFKPGIKKNMRISGFIALLLGGFLAFFLEYLKKERERIQK